MDSMTVSLYLLGATILFSFLYGLLTQNYSTVDRLWSILPIIYVLIWMPEHIGNTRYLFASSIVILWGVRLTGNFALKGGYDFDFKHGFRNEDYRWAVLRQKIDNRLLFELFNLFFICCFQLGLIFLFTLPLYHYGEVTDHTITTGEVVLYSIHILLLTLETIADIQQYIFYSRRDEDNGEEQPRYDLGFNTFGMFTYLRHPNYLFEVGQWVVVYAYYALASGRQHFSAVGCILLIALFAGSTRFTESISSSKYPRYDTWKSLVSACIPIKTFLKRKEREEFLRSIS